MKLLKDNKGFSVSGILYPLFLLFITLVILIIFNLTLSRVLITKQKNDLMAKINGEFVEFQIVFPQQKIYDVGSNIDLLDNVEAVGRGSANAVITYTSNPPFDSSKEGSYTINYKAVSVLGKITTAIREIIIIKDSYDYSYSGKIETFTAPISGFYELQTWGASGGNSGTAKGGAGAYAQGNYYMNAGETIYIGVGGKGASNCTGSYCNGGYNGGGGSDAQASHGSGGGATHISQVTGLLNTLSTNKDKVLIVAAGGGGASSYSGYVAHAGYGGAEEGAPGNIVGGSVSWPGRGGTQTVGGSSPNCGVVGSFGQGGSRSSSSAGGGGGWFGGGCGWGSSGGGGSSYVAKINNSYSKETKMIPGNQAMPNPTGGTMTGNTNDGYVRIKYKIDFNENTDQKTYVFSNKTEEFIASKDGYYKLEAWGASGGDSNSAKGGAGAYATGRYYMKAGDKIYVTVGQRGMSNCIGYYCAGGYNGGGGSDSQADHGSGGGATHFALETGILSTFNTKRDKVVLAAAGGGGASSYSGYVGHAGYGGTSEGGKAAVLANSDAWSGRGGTQTVGGLSPNCGVAGSFGQGGSRGSNSAGGGGGWFGGGCGWGAAGGGGSSFIANIYNNGDETSFMKAGNEKMPTFDGTNEMLGNSAHGYAKITYEETYRPNLNEHSYAFSNKTEEFIAPKDGYYKLEAWGARGGDSNTAKGGNGGYASGNYYMKAGDKIYVTVGQYGISNCIYTYCAGGYNGGGGSDAANTNGSGGGATHFATEIGILSTFNSKRDKVLLVAAGGGGASSYGGYVGHAGAGGGLEGMKATVVANNDSWPGRGGTQTAGGLAPNCIAGSFGQGGSRSSSSAGGGGGWFGGGCGHGAAGGGGSSYTINNLINSSNISGDKTIPEYDSYNKNNGLGYAKITYIKEDENYSKFLTEEELIAAGYSPTDKNIINMKTYRERVLEESTSTLSAGSYGCGDRGSCSYNSCTTGGAFAERNIISLSGSCNFYNVWARAGTNVTCYIQGNSTTSGWVTLVSSSGYRSPASQITINPTGNNTSYSSHKFTQLRTCWTMSDQNQLSINGSATKWSVLGEWSDWKECTDCPTAGETVEIKILYRYPLS